jgi:hypothetical protein
VHHIMHRSSCHIEALAMAGRVNIFRTEDGGASDKCRNMKGS